MEASVIFAACMIIIFLKLNPVPKRIKKTCKRLMLNSQTIYLNGKEPLDESSWKNDSKRQMRSREY